MGIQEKEIIDLFRKMRADRQGAGVSEDGIAMLTAARILKRVMEKCVIEVCGSLEEIRDGLRDLNNTIGKQR